MLKCLYCDTEFNDNNGSKEHIIPNALGGRKKTRNACCKDCNNSFGESIDFALASNFQEIASLLNIQRERGEPREIKNAIGEDGEKYRILPGGKPDRLSAKPIVIEDGGKTTYHAQFSTIDIKSKVVYKEYC